MSEDEWLAATDPLAMCDFVREATENWKTRWLGWVKAKRFKVSDRKWRLIELACCKRLAERVDHPWLHELLPQARLLAEGRLSSRGLAEAIEKVKSWIGHLYDRLSDFPSPAVAEEACWSATAIGRLFAATPGDGNVLWLTARAGGADPNAELRHQARFVRDILGNPFRPERLDPDWLRANGRIAERLAREIEERGTYEELPVLGDALEDAGCDRPAVLAHCREAKFHVRGCWVLDLLLGKN
jgi:hypothetical protein